MAAGFGVSLADAPSRSVVPGAVHVVRMFGFDVFAHPRLLLFALAAVVVATPVSPIDAPGITGLSPATFVAYAALASVLSVLAHELGHAIVIRACGLRVRSIYLDVGGGHTVPSESGKTPLTFALIAFAGPAVNLAIWFFLGGASGFMSLSPTPGADLSLLANLNLYIGLLNLLPVGSSDGGHAFEAGWWMVTGDRVSAARFASATGHIAALVVIAVAVLLANREFGSSVAATVAVYGGWTVLRSRSGGDPRHQRMHTMHVRDVMVPGLLCRSDDLARTLVARQIERKHASDLSRQASLDLPYLVVGYDGEIAGAVTASEVEELARERLDWNRITIEAVMTPARRLLTLEPSLSLHEALVMLLERQLDAAFVVDDGEPVGCLTMGRLQTAIEQDQHEDVEAA